ncbi:MAG: hypothetical protein U9N84_15130 [Actinomycetota bacterium]|nr:hypothetical protein [Actinomycetota bacterium]
MAIDIAGFVTYVKDHAVEHGFHVHDERHFIETVSLRQSFEIDLHPESACDGPLDLNLAFDVEPRVLLSLEDWVKEHQDDLSEADGNFQLPMFFNWALPTMKKPPDLVVLATELAGIGGPDLPIEVSGVESTGALSTGADRRLSIVGKVEMSLVDVMMGQEQLCDILDRCRDVSEFLVTASAEWGVEYPPPPPEE